MKKVLLAAAITGLLIGGLATQANVTTTDERGFISASASANKEIASDVAEISIEVQTFDTKSMQKAMTDNNEISQNKRKWYVKSAFKT